MGHRPFAVLLALLCCRLAAQSETNDPLQLSVKPGVYRQDVLLVIGTSKGYEATYQFADDGAERRFLPLASSLALGALEGETRDYRVLVNLRKDGQPAGQQELLYTIDKTVPFSPEPDIAPGTWYAPVEPRFSLPRADAGDRILHSWTASDGSAQVLREGNRISLAGSSGALVSYRLTVYTEDAVRHTSQPMIWNYTVDRRRERTLSEIPVYSPVEGRFRNPQYCYLDHLAFSEVRFTLDGSDPRNGTPYTGGFLIEQSGRVNLRLWARTQKGDELTRSIVYEAGTERLAELESGVVGQTRTVQIERETYRYAAGERLPGPGDESLTKPLRISPQTGALRGVALRLLRERDQAQFRYYLVLDGRQPQAPELWARTLSPTSGALETLQGAMIVNDTLELSVRGSEGSKVWYRIDGRNPADNPVDSLAAGGSLSIRNAVLAAAARPDGTCLLVFQGRQADGAWGPPTRLVVRPASPITGPDLNVRSNSDGSVSLVPGSWNGSIWYRIESGFHGATHQGPFRLDGPADLILPPGATTTVKLQYFGRDPDGRTSQAVNRPQFEVSNLLPREPEIKVGGDNSVTLAGSGSIRYRVLSDVAAAPSATTRDQPYLKPFFLKELAGVNLRYQIEAWSEDASGRSSAVVRSDPVYSHNRPPQAASVAEGGNELFRNSRSFTLAVARPEGGMRYQYVLGLPGAVADPDHDSPWTTGDIAVKRDESDVDLELRIRAVSSVRPDLVSPVSRIIIHVMTTPPPAPSVGGVSAGGWYNHPLEIVLSSPVAGQLRYRLAAGELTDQTPWLDYRQAIRLSAPPDSDQSYQIQARMLDRAGNVGPSTPVMDFRIVTRTPVLVPLGFRTAEGERVVPLADNSLLSRTNLRVGARADDGQEVRYVLVDDQNSLSLPDASAKVLSADIVLTVAEGSDKTWHLQYRVLDKAGNASLPSPVYTITIDRQPPAAPEPPQLSRQGNSGSLSWIIPDDADLEFFFSSILPTDGAPEFRRYTGERVPWSLDDGDTRLYLLYRSRDAAGNVSGIQTLLIEPKRPAALPQVDGVVDGGLYKDAVSIRVAGVEPGGSIRYELSIGDQNRIEASSQSSVMPQVLEVGPLPGETVHYQLSVRQFVDGLDASAVRNISFTIDRTPPRTPEIRGLPGVLYSSDGLEVRLEGDPADQVWYSLQTDVLPQTSDQQVLPPEAERKLRETAIFHPSDADALRFAGHPGQVIRYLLLAYSLDLAGNRSQSTPLWQVFVDGDSVYVSDPSAQGWDAAASLETGARSQPFHDLGTALDFAVKNGKHSLRLGSGRFPINRTLNIPEGLLISGGYQPGTWVAGGKEPTILYPRSGFADRQLINAPNGIALQRLFLADGGIRLDAMVSSGGGSTFLENCNLAVTQTRSGLRVADGRLVLRNSVVSCNDPLDAELLALDRVTCQIQSSILESADLPPVLLKNLSRAEYRLIRAVDSTITVDDSEIRPRRGQVTTAVSLRGGSFAMNGRLLSAGGGAVSATAVDGDGGADIRLSDTRCKTEAMAGNAVLLRLRQARLTIRGGGLDLTSTAGIYGIMAEDSDIEVDGSDLHGGRALDFMTLFSLKSSRITVSDSHLSGADTRDFRIASLAGGESNWTGNTVQIQGGTSASGLFFMGQGGTNVFTGNTFSGDDQHTLFYLGSADGSLTVRSNILEHWRFILQEGDKTFSRQSDLDRGFNSLQLLESTRRQGSLFEGNKVRQGL